MGGCSISSIFHGKSGDYANVEKDSNFQDATKSLSPTPLPWILRKDLKENEVSTILCKDSYAWKYCSVTILQTLKYLQLASWEAPVTFIMINGKCVYTGQ